MRMLIAVLSLITVAGCAGPAMNQARSAGPLKTFTSNKDQLIVAQCIQFAWQDEAVFDVDAAAYLESSSEHGTTVFTRGAEYFADVKNRGGATTVEYYVAKSEHTAPRRLAGLATCL